MTLRIEVWGPPLGPVTGGNIYDRLLTEGLRARGHDVTIREFDGRSGNARSGNAQDPRRTPDVVLQDELLHRMFLHENLSWKGPRPRIVALVHHLQSSEPERGEAELGRLRQEERAYLKTVDGILAPSRASAEAARQLSGRPLAAAVAAPGGDRFAGAALPPLPGPGEISARASGPLTAAFVANLIPRKRLLEVLEAVATVPEWSLSVAGREDVDPGYTDRARRRAAAADLRGRVTFEGVLGPEALAALLRKSCLLVVPSTHEGFGIVYLEGFAFGLPALAAASGGAPEIVSEGETGWLIRSPDGKGSPGKGAPGGKGASERVAECLRLLAADRGRLATMGLRASARHRTQPTWGQSSATAEGVLAPR